MLSVLWKEYFRCPDCQSCTSHNDCINLIKKNNFITVIFFILSRYYFEYWCCSSQNNCEVFPLIPCISFETNLTLPFQTDLGDTACISGHALNSDYSKTRKTLLRSGELLIYYNWFRRLSDLLEECELVNWGVLVSHRTVYSHKK